MINEDDFYIVLSDGSKIDKRTGKVVKETKSVSEDNTNDQWHEVVEPTKAQEIILQTQKTVADLPVPPSEMSAIGLVAFYTLYGLNNTNIALAVEHKLTVAQIEYIKEQQLYKDFLQEARRNLMQAETATVKELINTNAKKAASKVIQLVDDEDSLIALKAAQDLLDRSGNKPNAQMDVRVGLQEALQIVFIKKDQEPPPTIISGEIIRE